VTDKPHNTLKPRNEVGLDDETQFVESLSQPDAGDTIAAVVVDPDATTLGDAGPAAGTGQGPTWVGKKLSHFKLLRLLGQGSMGMVIQAEDVNLQRIVALKVLRKRIAGMDERVAVEQFLREARAAASLAHPNVVRVHEINQHRGWWYIAYEMIEGGNLKTVVKTVGPLPANRVCPVIADAATALAVAHQAGVIHRDVKPSNLMLTRTGRCKLMDFGLVRMADPNDPFDFTDKSVGTPQYMSPEVIRQKRITPAVDIYSLGCTLYFGLVGQPPFVGRSQREVLTQHLECSPPDPRDRQPSCPESLAALLERMLAKNPEARPNAADVAVALRTEAIHSAEIADDPNMSTGSFFAMATSKDGSTVAANVETLAAADRTPPAGIRSAAGSKRRLWATVAAAVVLLLVCGAFVALQLVDGVRFERVEAFGDTFNTTAQPTYGTRAPGDLPLAEPPTSPPPFSWRGTIDPGDARFVAARDGTRYYELNDPRAWLISADQFVGYPTATAALADGKQPAR